MKKILLLLWTGFLFSFILVSAQTGCFSYPDSALYCNEIEMEQAQQECFFYSDCSLEQYFSSGESCQNQDLFPPCQKVWCKSTCRQEWNGKCSAGSFALTEKEQWCSAGCCQFKYSGSEYCGFKKNHWLCEIESKNKEATTYSFNSPLSEEVCLHQCGKVSIEEEQTAANEDNSSILVSPLVQDENENSSLGIFWWGLFILILFLGFYSWNKWKGKFTLSSKKQAPIESSSLKRETPISSRWFTFKKKLTPQQKHHLKEKERKKFFMETGLVPGEVKKKEDFLHNLHRLNRLTHAHQINSASVPTFKPEENEGESKKEKMWEKMALFGSKKVPEEVKEAPIVEIKSLEAPSSRRSEGEEALKSLRDLVPKKKIPSAVINRLEKISPKK
ncbi:MAG: hypothetical protein V2A62_05675 [Candidatus Woesearchaeota archaeon]